MTAFRRYWLRLTRCWIIGHQMPLALTWFHYGHERIKGWTCDRCGWWVIEDDTERPDFPDCEDL